MIVVDTTVVNDPSHVSKECLGRGILFVLYFLLDTVEVSWMDDIFKVVRERRFAHGCME